MKPTAVQWLLNELSEINSAIAQKEKEIEKERIISFAEWYSGMEKEKVERAYQRYLNETLKNKRDENTYGQND